jgi:CRP-like cAMP-binding protein
MDSMLDRFSGDEGRRRLTDQLVKQLIVAGNAKLAARISDVGEVIEATEGQAIIRQDAADNDLFLIVSGSLRILVNGRDVAIRRAGEHVGEMAIVDPSTARTAAVVAA